MIKVGWCTCCNNGPLIALKHAFRCEKLGGCRDKVIRRWRSGGKGSVTGVAALGFGGGSAIVEGAGSVRVQDVSQDASWDASVPLEDAVVLAPPLVQFAVAWRGHFPSIYEEGRGEEDNRKEIKSRDFGGGFEQMTKSTKSFPSPSRVHNCP